MLDNLSYNFQVEDVCETLASLPELKDGYNAVGFSQGENPYPLPFHGQKIPLTCSSLLVLIFLAFMHLDRHSSGGIVLQVASF